MLKSIFKMENWNRVPSLVQQLLLQFIGLIGLAAGLAAFLIAKGGWGCPTPSYSTVTKTTYFALGIGLFSLGWLIWRIFSPKVLVERWRPVLKAGPVVLPNPTIPSVQYSFLSSHPSYVFVDFLVVAVGLFFRLIVGAYPPAYGCANYLFPYVFGWCMLGISLLIPILRLTAWYLLQRREKSEIAAWKPVFIFCAIAYPPLIAIPVMVFGEPLLAPLVQEKNFAGGLQAHSEFKDKQVRLEGIVKDGTRCNRSKSDSTSFGAASLLLDLGAGGEVIVHGLSDHETWLAIQKEKNLGKKIRIYGTLQELPGLPEKKYQFYDSQGRFIQPKGPEMQRAYDFEYRFLDCGWKEYGPSPAAGRAFLKM